MRARHVLLAAEPDVDARLPLLAQVGQRDRIYAARRQWRMWAPAAAAGRVDVAEEPAAPAE